MTRGSASDERNDKKLKSNKEMKKSDKTDASDWVMKEAARRVMSNLLEIWFSCRLSLWKR